MSTFLAVDHPRFHKVDRDVFLKQVTADCMTHECRLMTQDGRIKLDACCQYGADTDLGERDAILAHEDEIRPLLRDDVQTTPWFTDEEQQDKDFPSGKFVRTNTAEFDGHATDRGCLFLAHDGRGCAVHRASIEHNWDFRGVKPHVCRLFPLSYDDESILFSDDYNDYSCARDPNAPSVYRVSRDTLGDVFGAELIAALDTVEQAVLAADSSINEAVVIPTSRLSDRPTDPRTTPHESRNG